MAKVSIVTSVYNKEPWLRRGLDSFVNQTYSDLEILVIDNASTDGSLDIIEEYAKKDKRIRVIRLNENIGPGGGYETGINNVETEYFCLVDSDDYLELNYIDVLYKKIIKNHADMAMCTNDLVWDDGTIKTNRRPGRDIIFTQNDIPQLLPQLLDPHSNRYLGFYLEELGVVWGKLYNTDFIRKNNLNYRSKDWLWLDWIFNFRFYKKMKKMVYTEDTSYHFFQSEGSVTRKKGMNWELNKQVSSIMDDFYEESQDIITPDLTIALNKFYYWNVNILTEMYLSNYPEITNRRNLKELSLDIRSWKGVKKISFFFHKGLTFKQYLKVILIRNNIFVPFLFNKVGG